MFKKGDYVVYKKNVCIIKDIIDNYYILCSLEDKTLTIKVPVNSEIRNVISKKECQRIIRLIPNIETIKIADRNLELEYKRLLSTGNLEDLIKIIKTTYLRNKNRLSSHKKIGEKDDTYFKKAEKLLYDEMSISLNLTFNETKKYVESEVKKYEKIGKFNNELQNNKNINKKVTLCNN